MDDGGRALPMDPGAAALAFLLQLLGVPADPAEILHQSGKASLEEADVLRSVKRFPVKARAISAKVERSMPVISTSTV